MFAKTGVRAPGRLGRLLVAAGLLLPLAAVVHPAIFAGDEETGSTYARVRWLDSGLTIERLSEGELLTASPNLPIIPGDQVSTAAGRAEIELADSSIVWLDEATRLEVRNLADYDNRYERTNLLVLRRGVVRIDSREASDADGVFQIDTEAGSIYLLSEGSFRIEANGTGTIVSSYSGVAEFSGEGGSVLVRTGQRSSVAIGAVPDEPRRFNTSRSDDFDRFHDDRVAAYVTSSEPGLEEVDDVPVEVRPYVRELSYYGSWTTISPYGMVWRPVFASGWSPYTHGTWAWYPTGWVWVSYDPWGWAPYRYGRWDYAPTYGWFWVPGRVWSGAWVSFAVSTTYVGWCPLNYWNRPVFHDPWIAGVPAVHVARLDPRGWQFVPAGRFGMRGVTVAATRIEHLPRTTEVVVTRSLPAPARPRAVPVTRTDPAPGFYDQVRRSRVALPAASTASGEPISFRVQEQRRAAVPAASKRSSAPPRGRASTPRPAPADAIAMPQQSATASPATRPQPQGRAHGPQPKAPPRASGIAPPPRTSGTPDACASGAAVPPRPTQTTPGRPPAPRTPTRQPQETARAPRQAAPPAAPPQETKSSSQQHNPAVGRLVGGARPAPARPPQPTTPPSSPDSIAPASQPEPESQSTQSPAPARGNRGKNNSKAGRPDDKPKEQGSRPSGR